MLTNIKINRLKPGARTKRYSDRDGLTLEMPVKPACITEECNKRQQRLNAAKKQFEDYEKQLITANSNINNRHLTHDRIIEISLGSVSLKSEFDKLSKQYEHIKNLDKQYVFECKKFETNKRTHQLKKYLERYNVQSAYIKGITPALKAGLVSNGIETAANIDYRAVNRVVGFGPVRTAAMMDWRNKLERGFVFDPNLAIDPREISPIKAKYNNEKIRLAKDLKEGLNRLICIKNDILMKRARYKELRDMIEQCMADMRPCKIN